MLEVESDFDEDEMFEDEDEERVRVFRPGQDKLGEGEELDFDPAAYEMFHTMAMDWPCLTFDILHDTKGMCRSSYPMSCSLVAGSQ